MTHRQEQKEGEVSEFALRQAAISMGARVLTRVMATYAVLTGISILVGGPSRFSTEMSGYAIASGLPGAPHIWGIWLILSGLMVTWGLLKSQLLCIKVGLLLSGVWSIALSIAFARAAVVYPHAGVIGLWAYGKDSVIFFVMAVAFHSRYYRKLQP